MFFPCLLIEGARIVTEWKHGGEFDKDNERKEKQKGLECRSTLEWQLPRPFSFVFFDSCFWGTGSEHVWDNDSTWTQQYIEQTKDLQLQHHRSSFLQPADSARVGRAHIDAGVRVREEASGGATRRGP